MMRTLLMSLLLLCTISSLPAQAGEEIAKVIAARGDAHAVNVAGEQRALKRRSAIFSGDTLVTGEDARLQVRFADGTLLALRPASEYRIEGYRYHQSEDDENFSTLLKGGFRTITGVISKGKPEAYEVKTPVATIGVRGTNYEVALTNNGLDVAAWRGGVEVSTGKGALVIGAGQDFNYASVGSVDAKPQGLLKPPPSMSGPLLDGGETEAVTESGGSGVQDEQTATEGSDEGGDEQAETSTEMQDAGGGSADGEAATSDNGEPTASAEESTDTSFGGESTDDGLLSGTEPTADSGDSVLGPVEVGGDTLDPILSDDPTLTPVEPIDTVDPRLTPQESEILLNDGWGGMLVHALSHKGIFGGRTVFTGNASPVFTYTSVEPYDPAFKDASIEVVIRQGKAPVDEFHRVGLGTADVYWGVWNGSASPVKLYPDASKPTDSIDVDEPLFWTVFKPEDPMRTDTGVYSHIIEGTGGGTLGKLTPGDMTFSMNVNFNTGAISNGVFEVNKNAELWHTEFNGKVRGAFVNLDIDFIKSHVNYSDAIDGGMGGAFTGSKGRAYVGAFDLQNKNNPTHHIEGLLIVDE